MHEFMLVPRRSPTGADQIVWVGQHHVGQELGKLDTADPATVIVYRVVKVVFSHGHITKAKDDEGVWVVEERRVPVETYDWWRLAYGDKHEFFKMHRVDGLAVNLLVHFAATYDRSPLSLQEFSDTTASSRIQRCAGAYLLECTAQAAADNADACGMPVIADLLRGYRARRFTDVIAARRPILEVVRKSVRAVSGSWPFSPPFRSEDASTHRFAPYSVGDFLNADYFYTGQNSSGCGGAYWPDTFAYCCLCAMRHAGWASYKTSEIIRHVCLILKGVDILEDSTNEL